MTDAAFRAKTELESYKLAKREILNLRDKIADVRARIEATSRPAREVDVQSSGDPNGIENLLAILVDLQIFYGQKQVQAEHLCYRLEIRIGQVAGLPGMILERKYIQGHQLEKIAVDLDYSYRQAKRLHNKGLEAYAKRWNQMSP